MNIEAKCVITKTSNALSDAQVEKFIKDNKQLDADDIIDAEKE